MVVTSEIMDVILASTDALRQMIDNLESTNAEGEVEIGHIMAQIDAIMAGETAPQPVAAEPEAAPQPEVLVETASVVEEPAISDEQPTVDEAAEAYSESSNANAADTPAATAGNEEEFTAMLELLSNRRSIRKFTDQAVSDEHLEKLLMAGLLAPSSKDTRPVELVAVRDKAVIAALADCRDSGTMVVASPKAMQIISVLA